MLPDGPLPGSGVPPVQVHVFLRRGLHAVEALLPGLGAELLDAGAVEVGTDRLAWLGGFGWTPAGPEAFVILSASRPLFEHLVLRRVRSLPGVRVRDGVRVDAGALLARGTREPGRLSAYGDVLAGASIARVHHLIASPRLLFRPGLLVVAVRARVRG